MRTHCVSVRLNPAELTVLDSQRGTLPRGAYLRRAWLGARLPRPLPAANQEALLQLRGLATNLNQLARHANADHAIELGELHRLVGNLRLTLAGLTP